MTAPVRISRRAALAGGTAAALLAGGTLAQAQSSPAVPAAAEPFAFEHDVLFEHEAVAGQPFEIAFPKMAPFPPRVPFGPQGVESLRQQLAQVKADRDFAQGKMDLAAVDVLLQGAEPLVAQAEAKQPSQPAPSVERPGPGMVVRKLGPFALSREARQASARLRAASAQMEAALGGVLPSHGQRVGKALTMAHRVVAESGAAARNNAAASALATQAQGLYKQAYDAHQAGQYDKASAHARAALATAEAARAAVEPEPARPGAAPAAPPPPTF